MVGWLVGLEMRKGQKSEVFFFRIWGRVFICFVFPKWLKLIGARTWGFLPRRKHRDPRAVCFSFSCFTVFLSAIPSLRDLWGVGGSAGVSGWKQGVYLEMYVLLTAATMWESFPLGNLCGWQLFFKIAESKTPFSGNDKGTTKRVMGGKYDNSATGSRREELLSVQINKCLFRRKGR